MIVGTFEFDNEDGKGVISITLYDRWEATDRWRRAQLAQPDRAFAIERRYTTQDGKVGYIVVPDPFGGAE